MTGTPRSRAPLISLCVLAPFALACASVPPPTETVDAAEKSILEATQSDAEPFARLEMHQAREHLTQAQSEVAQERFAAARESAEKALVEAELAKAKADAVRAERNADEIREHVATLQREIERSSQLGR
jgi:type IV pilus biogenesis protein CpaD/CtpE